MLSYLLTDGARIPLGIIGMLFALGKRVQKKIGGIAEMLQSSGGHTLQVPIIVVTVGLFWPIKGSPIN